MREHKSNLKKKQAPTQRLELPAEGILPVTGGNTPWLFVQVAMTCTICSLKVIKKAVKKIVVKKQYSIPMVKFFPNFTYFLSAFNFENFVNSGKIREFDKIPSGACIRKLP